MEEALTSGNVIGTAKRYGIQAQQIYRWREWLDERQGPAVFLALSVSSEPMTACQAPVLDEDSRECRPASVLERSPRVEIVLSSDRRIIVEGSVDVEAVLKLARGR